MELVPGASLGPYRIIEQVGRGGMATVFKAFQPALNRFVALKVLPAALAADPEFRERFTQEAMAVAALRHPNILSIFDYGQEGEIAYLVTEFVDGGTLNDQMEQPLPLEYVVSMLRPVAAALDYAHSRGIVHRDVKPSNVLLTREATPVLSDFGLARMMQSESHLTQVGMLLGTPEYMAPEQCAGDAPGPAADQYSLAVVAYQMLTGHVPFSAETPAAVILAQLSKPLPLPRSVNPELSDAVEAALLKGLAKEAKSRFSSASAFVRALEPVAAAVAPVATTGIAGPAAAAQPAGRPRPVSRAMVLAGLLVLVIVLASIALVFARGGPTGARPLGAGSPASTSHATASPSPTPTPLLLAKGGLLYEAPLDGSGNEFDNRYQQGDPAASAFRTPRGAAEFAILKSNGNLGVALKYDPPSRYVTEIEVAVEPGSLLTLVWTVRTGNNLTPPGNHLVIVDAAQETLQIVFFEIQQNPSAPPKPNEPLAPQVKLAGLRAGNHFTFDTLVDPPLYRLFVNGSAVSEARDDRTDQLPNVAFAAYGRSGTVRLTAIKVFAPAG